jgi:hypothetical protein
MKAHAGVDKDSGLIHSVVVTPANVHDLTPAAQRLHADEEVVHADARYQTIAKRPEMEGKATEFRVAIRPGKRRALPNTPEGRLDYLVETAKAHFRSKVEYPFRVIKQQFGFQKTRLRGMAKNHCKIYVMAALTNLFLGRRRLMATTESEEWHAPIGSITGEKVQLRAERSTKSVHEMTREIRPELLSLRDHSAACWPEIPKCSVSFLFPDNSNAK